ncbi:MAG: hypothetical protein NVS3B26_30470 [Mycobacteriales bacterium]
MPRLSYDPYPPYHKGTPCPYRGCADCIWIAHQTPPPGQQPEVWQCLLEGHRISAAGWPLDEQ